MALRLYKRMGFEEVFEENRAVSVKIDIETNRRDWLT